MTYYKTITSNGKPACIVDGYGFTVERTPGDKTTWYCNRKRHGQCKARLYTIGTHNQEPNACAAEVIQARVEINEQSKSSNRSTHDIIAGGIASLSTQASCLLIRPVQS